MVAACALATTGCTSWSQYWRNNMMVGPAYMRPPAPVEVDWIDAGDLPPGNYEIEARLVQTADGPLSACGVAPVRRPLVIP